MAKPAVAEVAHAGARVHDLKDVEAILDVFQAHGHSEVQSETTWVCRLFVVTTSVIID